MDSHNVTLLLFDLALILALARVAGGLAVRFRQPPVVGEIVAGVLLGPTILGGAVADVLFPPHVLPVLTAMADVGVALFMFLVGMELDTGALGRRARLVLTAAAGSCLVPFAAGAALALWLLRYYPTTEQTAFVVFVGLASAVTAFPVLARILSDRGLSRTQLGGIALATAAVVDAFAWVALAGVEAAAGTGQHQWRAVLLVPLALFLVLAVRPLLRRYVLPAGSEEFTPGKLTLVLAGVLLCAAATEAMGVHYIFGAFLFGLAVPQRDVEARGEVLRERTQQVTSLLLPIFFVITGLRVDLSALRLEHLGQLALILLVLVTAKFGGTYLAARSQHLPVRSSTALATMVSTKGLTDLVVLGVGLGIGLLHSTLYTLMVTAAVTITALTGPVLTLIYRKPVEVPPPTGRDGVLSPRPRSAGSDEREAHATGRT